MIADKKETEYDNKQKSLVNSPIPEEGWIPIWIEQKLKNNGISPRWAKRACHRIIREWNNTPISSNIKKWGIRRGFLPSTIVLYHLNEDNYSHFLSDIDYYRLHPLNNHFVFWINDKITLKYIFSQPICINKQRKEFVNLMPDYFLYIENDGHYSYLMDVPNYIKKDSYFLLHLLQDKGRLAMKPSNGGGGYGFVDLIYKNNEIFWNQENISQTEFNKRKSGLNGYIVTAYITQNHAFDEVWDKSVATLRIIAVKQIDDTFNGGHIDIISSYIRFGTYSSDGACNMHTGGVAIHYDPDTGEYGDFFFRYPGFGEEGQTRYDAHPDTHCCLKGKKLPHHEKVKDAVIAICEHLSSLQYFGIDLVVTEEGIQLLEINSLPAISSPQSLEGPLFKNPKAAQFFHRKLSEIENK